MLTVANTSKLLQTRTSEVFHFTAVMLVPAARGPEQTGEFYPHFSAFFLAPFMTLV